MAGHLSTNSSHVILVGLDTQIGGVHASENGSEVVLEMKNVLKCKGGQYKHAFENVH